MVAPGSEIGRRVVDGAERHVLGPEPAHILRFGAVGFEADCVHYDLYHAGWGGSSEQPGRSSRVAVMIVRVVLNLDSRGSTYVV